MDFLNDPLKVVSMASLLLLMLLNTQRALSLAASSNTDAQSDFDSAAESLNWETSTADVNAATEVTLHHFRLLNTLSAIDEDLRFWVKPRSTTWFSRFLLQEYDDGRWVQMFRMSKRSIFSLTQLLSPALKKKDTKYRLAVPVTVRIACTLFKLSHGASLLICSELFAVGRSTVSIMLRQVVNAINVALRNEIMWPARDAVRDIAQDFNEMCGLPGIAGAIDGTHIPIAKPRSGVADYYYFKFGGYTINCQAVVDNSKKFLDLYVGMPGGTNDARVFRRSSLFERGQRGTLWDGQFTFAGFTPYLLGDAGYPLLSWLMVPHRRSTGIPLVDQLFNKRLSKGRVIVENAFALLKSTFRELRSRCDLQVEFIPDVVVCCTLLHNSLLKQSDEEVGRLMGILQDENPDDLSCDTPPHVHDVIETAPGMQEPIVASQKRRDLGILLSLQRRLPA